LFEGLGNFAEMMKMVTRVRGEAARIGEEMKQLIVEGSAGGGMVKVRVNGKQEVLECKIDPQVFADHDAELLEDLILAATNQALQKAKEALTDRLRQATGGINIPGLTDALGSLGGGTPDA
jgi:DNA-binding YbaB/EbfC family protein